MLLLFRWRDHYHESTFSISLRTLNQCPFPAGAAITPARHDDCARFFITHQVVLHLHLSVFGFKGRSRRNGGERNPSIFLGSDSDCLGVWSRQVDRPRQQKLRAWRFFPNRPKQYTDNELNCGGFIVQSQNKGRWVVCGDAYHIKNPKYTYPGKYADGFITKNCTEGQEIEVIVEVTSNHQGFFRFSVGKLAKPPITQKKLNHVLLQPDGANTWPLHSSRNGLFKIKLVLPKGLTCDHCVMQWWWTVGNFWGCDDNGQRQRTGQGTRDFRELRRY